MDTMVRSIESIEELRWAVRTSLKELSEVGGDILPIEANVEHLVKTLMLPALRHSDPLLVCQEEEAGIVGFILWPVLRDGIEYKGGPRALGFMTWVRPSFRRKGIATWLRNIARERLRDRGVSEVVGVVLPENTAGLASLSRVEHENRGVVIHSRI